MGNKASFETLGENTGKLISKYISSLVSVKLSLKHLFAAKQRFFFFPGDKWISNSNLGKVLVAWAIFPKRRIFKSMAVAQF